MCGSTWTELHNLSIEHPLACVSLISALGVTSESRHLWAARHKVFTLMVTSVFPNTSFKIISVYVLLFRRETKPIYLKINIYLRYKFLIADVCIMTYIIQRIITTTTNFDLAPSDWVNSVQSVFRWTASVIPISSDLFPWECRTKFCILYISRSPTSSTNSKICHSSQPP